MGDNLEVEHLFLYVYRSLQNCRLRSRLQHYAVRSQLTLHLSIAQTG
ncbi:MAG TPA: hypothetical protein V6D35_23050 [Candidatus Sericytochromatia bacterium]